jgi:hypothetical protein
VDALVPQDDAQPVGVVEDARAAEHIGEGVDLGGLTHKRRGQVGGVICSAKVLGFPRRGLACFDPQRPNLKVRDPVANRGRPDMALTDQIGRD